MRRLVCTPQSWSGNIGCKYGLMCCRYDSEWCPDYHQGWGSGVADLFGVWDNEEDNGSVTGGLCGVF